MIGTNTLKDVIIENDAFIHSIQDITQRESILFPDDESKKVVVFFGVRRSGKTYSLYSQFKKIEDQSLYIDFEDERLRDFSVDDFKKLKEAFLDLKPNLVGKRLFFYLDEIQNIPSWERYVRRASERDNIKIFVSGSSSKMTPKELHTTLRGRAWGIEVFPYSFKEYLTSRGIDSNDKTALHDDRRFKIRSHFSDFLKWGGFPEVCNSKNDVQKKTILKEYLSAIFFKDVVERFNVTNIELLDTLRDKLFESAALKLSLNSFYKQYKENFPFSKDSLFAYYRNFLESMIVFETRLFSPSSYKRQRNPPKIFLVDTGLARKLPNEAQGRHLENVVFLELKRSGHNVHYFENRGECDFIAEDASGKLSAIQVTLELNDSSKKREVDGVIEASSAIGSKEGLILTYDDEGEEKIDGVAIQILPVWKWLLIKRSI